MPPSYNQIAGQSVERLAALSDGVFAVAMTLLVLDLKVPAADSIHAEQDLAHALLALAPRLVIYLLSFMTLGIFWVGQQTQLNHLARGDRALAWRHLGFLVLITLMPFSTSLMAEFIALRLALLVYWLNIAALGLMLHFAWHHAKAAHLMKPEVDGIVIRSVEQRIGIAQGLYFAGALLCYFNTYWSITMFIVVQLNYAIAPRIPWLSKV